ncbi:hypothetical protein ACWDSJ_37680 [Nocardia sp. NPDC003482]
MKWRHRFVANKNSMRGEEVIREKEETPAAANGKATAEVSFTIQLSVPMTVLTHIGSSGATLALVAIAQHL